jgi:hypothetical protein
MWIRDGYSLVVTHGFATLKAAFLVEHDITLYSEDEREREEDGRRDGRVSEWGKDNRGCFIIKRVSTHDNAYLMTRHSKFWFFLSSTRRNAQNACLSFAPLFLRCSILHHFGFQFFFGPSALSVCLSRTVKYFQQHTFTINTTQSKPSQS